MPLQDLGNSENEMEQGPEGGPQKCLSVSNLARNVIWNLSGLAAPLFVALVTIPVVIHGMGKDRYGLLGIIWIVIGYFSLFDMGLGRALTKFVADDIGKGTTDELPKIVWTALSMIMMLGIAGAFIGVAVAKPIVQHVLNVPVSLQREGIISFMMASTGIPVVILTASLVGILEAHQKFPTINLIRVPMGVMTYAGPVISLQFTPNLIGATGILVATRIVALLIYFACVLAISPGLRKFGGVAKEYASRLFEFGSWITVSNIISPLMTNMDRFFIGSTLSLTAVAYYATPYNMLANMQLVPIAMQSVLFPAMATAAVRNREKLPPLYDQSTIILYMVMLPLTAFAFLFAPELLQIWLGKDFRDAAAIPMQIIALGWAISVIANSPFTILQSVGRPDLTAKIHLLVFPLYVVLLLILTKQFGITGTAVAWSIRMLIQTIFLNGLVRRILPELRRSVDRSYMLCLATVICFSCLWFAPSVLIKFFLLSGILVFVGYVLLVRTRLVAQLWKRSPHLS